MFKIIKNDSPIANTSSSTCLWLNFQRNLTLNYVEKKPITRKGDGKYILLNSANAKYQQELVTAATRERARESCYC